MTETMTSWQPEDLAGHAPYCAHPFHSLATYCSADPAEPDTLHGLPSKAWLRDHGKPPARSYVWDETVRTVHQARHGGTWESGTWVPRDDVTFTVIATRTWIGVSALLPAVADAEAVAARFPKSCQVRVTRTASLDWDGDRGSVKMQVKLSPDAVNRGVNEAGLRRYRSFARHAARLGYRVVYAATYGNSLTEGEFTALTQERAR